MKLQKMERLPPSAVAMQCTAFLGRSARKAPHDIARPASDAMHGISRAIRPKSASRHRHPSPPNACKIKNKFSRKGKNGNTVLKWLQGPAATIAQPAPFVLKLKADRTFMLKLLKPRVDHAMRHASAKRHVGLKHNCSRSCHALLAYASLHIGSKRVWQNRCMTLSGEIVSTACTDDRFPGNLGNQR
jgi:hypothetical protein